MWVVAAIVSFLAAVNWGDVSKYVASLLTPIVVILGKNIHKQLKAINATTKETPAIKAELTVVKSDVGSVKSDVAAVKVDVANVKTQLEDVKDQVSDVASDFGAVRREVAHRHVETRDHIDGLKDQIKHQNDISTEAFVKAVGGPLTEIAKHFTPKEPE